jgi:hypothetical protein
MERFIMKLTRNELCPIHRSRSCCGRERSSGKQRVSLGLRRIEDAHHPRGYREERSRAETFHSSRYDTQPEA